MAQKNLEISVLLDMYAPLLPEKQRTAVELYYNEDLSLSEIAEHAGISRQGVRDQIKHAENQLLGFEKALGLYKKSVETESILAQLEDFSNGLENEQLKNLILRLRKVNE